MTRSAYLVLALVAVGLGLAVAGTYAIAQQTPTESKITDISGTTPTNAKSGQMYDIAPTDLRRAFPSRAEFDEMTARVAKLEADLVTTKAQVKKLQDAAAAPK